MKAFGNIVLAAILVSGLVGASVFFRPLIAEHRELTARLDALEATNEMLRVQIDDLKVMEARMEDPARVELEGRRKGRVRPGEILFDFSDPEPQPTTQKQP